MATYINKSACKKAILSMAENRAHKFTRVGADVFEHLDSIIVNAMRGLVHSHPSIGKTIMMGSRKRKNEEESENM